MASVKVVLVQAELPDGQVESVLSLVKQAFDPPVTATVIAQVSDPPAALPAPKPRKKYQRRQASADQAPKAGGGRLTDRLIGLIDKYGPQTADHLAMKVGGPVKDVKRALTQGVNNGRFIKDEDDQYQLA